jgi:hypothetical protein
MTSEIVDVIPLILLECLNRSPSDFVCMYVCLYAYVAHANWGYLYGVLLKSLPPAIQTLQPPELYNLLTSLCILLIICILLILFILYTTVFFFSLYHTLTLHWKESRLLVLPRTTCFLLIWRRRSAAFYLILQGRVIRLLDTYVGVIGVVKECETKHLRLAVTFRPVFRGCSIRI